MRSPTGSIAMVIAILALGLAAACNGSRPPPQVEGRCQYVSHPGRCRFAETAIEPADSDDPGIVQVRSRYEWQGALPPPAFQRDLFVEWTVSRPGADAAMAWARQHGEVACVLAVDSGGCPPDGPNLAPDALPPPPAVPSDPRAAACPGVVTEQPPLNGAVAGLGTAPLLAALPPALASFRRVQGGGVAAGTAGHYADGASATYERGEVRLRVSIDDMIRVCTGAAGTGRALLSVEEAQDAQANLQPIAIGSREAVLVQWPGPPERTRVVTWLGDRCKLIVQPDGASPADGLTDLAAAIPLDALEQACRAR